MEKLTLVKIKEIWYFYRNLFSLFRFPHKATLLEMSVVNIYSILNVYYLLSVYTFFVLLVQFHFAFAEEDTFSLDTMEVIVKIRLEQN